MTGFEDYEVKISKRMKEVGIPALIDYIKEHAYDAEHKIYQQELYLVLQDAMPEITNTSVGTVYRACIKYIRYHKLLDVVSNQNGNWVATTADEMFNYEKKVYQEYIGKYNLFKAIVERRKERFPDFVPYDEEGNIVEWIED